MSRSAALASLILLTSSCAWHSEWTFALTEKCYDGACHDTPYADAFPGGYGGGKQEFAAMGVMLLGLIVLPVAIDLACLPVEWVHDQAIACE